MTEEHAKRCLRELLRHKKPSSLQMLRAWVGMTDREADKAMAWLKRRGLVKFVRQAGSEGGWVALTENGGWSELKERDG